MSEGFPGQLMRLALAADHAGFPLKEALKQWLESRGHRVDDLGTDSTASSDYPDFARKVAQVVGAGKAERGILLCGSGIGMCMVANKVRGVRATVLRDENDARLSREHNDANVACLGGRVTDLQRAQQLIELFLTTAFAGGRHTRRVGKIDAP